MNYILQKFDLKELYKMLRDAGIKCSKNRLADFLDKQVDFFFVTILKLSILGFHKININKK